MYVHQLPLVTWQDVKSCLVIVLGFCDANTPDESKPYLLNVHSICQFHCTGRTHHCWNVVGFGMVDIEIGSGFKGVLGFIWAWAVVFSGIESGVC